MVKHFARYGIPGLSLLVLLIILSNFNFNIAQISEKPGTIIAIIIVSGVLIVTVLVLILHHQRETRESSGASEVILLKYGQLTEGLGSPKQNVWAIEEIANSDHPQKLKFLRELQKTANLSFIEQDAIALLLERDNAVPARGLYETLHKKEAEKWMKHAGTKQMDMTWMAIIGLKIWRYLNRRNHPQFAQVEQALARVLTTQALDEKSFRLFNSLDIKE